MLEKRQVDVQTLRSLTAAFTTLEKSNQNPSESDYINVVRKAVKQREESACIYQENGRLDLFGAENAEKTVLEDYLPKEMTKAEVLELIGEVVVRTNLTLEKKNMGTLVKLVVADSGGTTDGKTVSGLVNKLIEEIAV